jgi:hypothetical protein
VTWHILEDECILLNLSTGDYFTLNNVGRFIWELLEEKKQITDICREIVGRYDVDEDTARRDTLEIVRELIGEGLVEQTDAP